jgi:hypothetical protein
MEELTKLYDLLVREGYYTNSFEEFESKYQDSSYRDKVFSVVSRDNFYTNSKEEFLEKYKPVKKKGISEPVGDTEDTTDSTTEQSPASPTSSDSQQSDPISERGIGFENQYSAPETEGVTIPLRPEEPSFRVANMDELGGDNEEALSSYQEEIDRKERASKYVSDQEETKSVEYVPSDYSNIQEKGDIKTQTLGEAVSPKDVADIEDPTISLKRKLESKQYISPEELSKMASEEGDRVERMKQDPYANTILQDDKLWEEENNFKKSLEIIDKKYIQKQEEIVVPELMYNFGRYGFSFEETGVGDAMVATASNGKELYVNLDPTFGLGSEESAAELIKFIEDNKADAYDDTENKFYRDNQVKIQDKKEIKSAVIALNDEFEKLNNSEIAITESLSKWQDSYNADFSEVKDYDQIKNDPILLEKFLEYNKAKKEINAEINALGDKERVLTLKGAQLDSLVGDYSTMQSKQGNMLGTLFNSFIKGAVSSKASQGLSKTIDALTYVLPGAGASDEDYKADLIESAKDLGLVDKDENLDDLSTDELIEKLGGDTNDFNFAADLLEIFALSIKNPELATAAYTAFKGSGTAFDQAHSKVLDKYRKELKYGGPRMYNPYSDVANTTDLGMGMLDAARSDFVLGIGGYNTKISSDATEQFKRIKSEGFFNEAFVGVAESLGTMIGSSYQRVPQMYMMVADHLDEEMSGNPEFDDISEAEKYFVEAPVGIASAVLEEFGLRNVLAQKGLLNGVILKALGKSTAGTTAKSFQKLIRDDINGAITSGLLVITAGGIAEFETGVAQQASELAIKDIYNEVKGRKMFETPDTWTDYSLQLLKAGGQEMVGGIVLGSIPATVTAIKKSDQNAKTADQKRKADIAFRIFDETLKDPEYRTMYVTKLKQKIASGEMTKAKAKEELAEYEKVLGIAPMVKSNLDSDQRKKAFELIYERQTIESNIESLDPNLVVDEKNRIKEINEELQNIKAKEAAPVDEEVVAEEAAPVAEERKGTFTIEPESYSTLSDGDKKIVDEGGILENSMYGFEVESKENLPDELKDLQESGILKVRGKGKKINRFSFTGKQLIESGYVAVMQAKETAQAAPVAQTAPVVQEAVAEEAVAEPKEVRYEMNKTDKKIWRKDFEIVDNRNGKELGPPKENGKWVVVNKVTGQVVIATSKRDAQSIIDNAPADPELFGEGQIVDADQIITPETGIEITEEATPVTEAAPVAQETTNEEITIFRGQEPKKDAEGNETTAHKLKDEKWKFGSAKIEGTDGYKGDKPIKKFTIPAGATIETVKLPGNTPAATSRVELETEAIGNSTAQVVKLETIDAGGIETQYIIKDDNILESGVDMTAEEEASAREDAPEVQVELSDNLKEEVEDIRNLLADPDTRVTENVVIKKEDDAELSDDSKKIVSIAKKASKAIGRVIPNVRIVLHNTTEEYTKFTGKEGRGSYNPKVDEEGLSYISINLSKANARTVGHEVFHAVLLDKIKTDEKTKAITKSMYNGVFDALQSIPETAKEIEEFSKKYSKDLESEEAIAELTGILASEYKQLDKKTKLKVKNWINQLANSFGFDNLIRLNNDEQVIEFLNVLSSKIAEGEVITESDIEYLEDTSEDVDEGPATREQKMDDSDIEETISDLKRKSFKNEAIKFYLVNDLKQSAKEVDRLIRKYDLETFDEMPKSFGNIEGGSDVGIQLFKKTDNYYSSLKKENSKIEENSIQKENLNKKIKDKKAEQKKTYNSTAQIDEAVKKYKGKKTKKDFRDKKIAERNAKKKIADKKVDSFVKRETKKYDNAKKRLSDQEMVDKVIEYLETQPEYKNEGLKGKEMSSQQAEMLSDLQRSVDQRPTAQMYQKIRKARLDLKQRKIAVRDIKKVQSEVRNFIRKVLPKKLYTKPRTIELINALNKATPTNLQAIIAKIEKFVVEENIKDLKYSLEKLLDTKKYTTIQNGRKVGKKISPESLNRINFIKEFIVTKKDATIEDIDKANESLNNEFERLLGNEVQSDFDIKMMADIQTAMSYNRSLDMSDSDSKKVEQLGSILSDIDSIITEGKSQLEEEIKKDKERTRNIFAIGYKAITGNSIDMSDPIQSAIDLENRRISLENKVARAKKTDGVIKSAFSYIVRGLEQGLFGSMEALDGLMDRIDMLPGEMFGGDLQDLFTDKVDASSRLKKARMLLHNKTMEDKLRELYGKNYIKKSRKNRIQIETNIFIDDSSKEKDSDYSFMSPNEMAYLYNQFKDPANLGSFAKMFAIETFNDEDSTEEKERKQKVNEDNAKRVMGEITAKLDNKTKAFADWLVDDFYSSLYDYYNAVYRKIYKADMPWNDFYAGYLKREGDPKDNPLNLIGRGAIGNTGVGSNSSKSRVRNTNKIEKVDITDSLDSYLNDMEHFAAYSETINDMHRFFENKNIKSAIESIHGERINKLINNMIEKIAEDGGKRNFADRFVNGLNSTFVVSRLALSPVIMIKQLTSLFTYANDIGIRNWMKYSFKNASEIAKIWKEVRDNSVYMQDRKNDSILNTIETYRKGSDSEKLSNLKEKIGLTKEVSDFTIDFMMWTTKFGDRTAIMLGGLPNYSYYKAEFKKKNPKATEQEAIDHAIIKFERDTKRTQQSSDLQDKDIFQTGPLRFLSMFLTTPKQYMRKEIQAARSLSRKLKAWDKTVGKGSWTENARTLIMYHLALPVFFQFISLGLPGVLRPMKDDDENDLVRSLVIGNLNSLFIFGQFVETLGDYMTVKPYAGEGAKTVGILTILNDIAKEFDRANKLRNKKKKAEAYKKAYLSLTTLTGLPAPTINRFIENYSEIGKDGDIGKDIARILNFSDYAKDGPKNKKRKFYTVKYKF